MIKPFFPPASLNPGRKKLYIFANITDHNLKIQAQFVCKNYFYAFIVRQNNLFSVIIPKKPFLCNNLIFNPSAAFSGGGVGAFYYTKQLRN